MKRLVAVLNSIVAVLMLVLIISVLGGKMDAERSRIGVRREADTGWHYQDGSAAVLSDIHYVNGAGDEGEISVYGDGGVAYQQKDVPRHALIYRDLDGEELSGQQLCFISTNVNFTVYLEDADTTDGEEKVCIYDYSPRLEPIYGISYGNDFHFVIIPGFSGNKRMWIELVELGGGSMWAGMQDAYFESGTEYMYWYLQKNHWKYQIAVLIFAAGLILAVLGVSVGRESGQQLELLSLGSLAMVLSIWTDSGTLMLELFTRNAGMIRVVNYVTLIFLPVPALTLVACLTKNRQHKLFYTILILSVVNIMLHLVGIMGGLLDYHDLLIVTHVVFLLGVIAAIYLSVLSVRQHLLDEGQVKTVLSAFFILVVSGMTDLIFYYLRVSSDMSRFSRFGLLLFVGILSVYEVRQFLVMAQKSREATLLDRLAHEDGLTGLYNRLAFNEYEKELLERREGSCIVIQFDINNLKKVNDTYGHGAGDSFITGGADSIKNSFGHYGKCFRTGGDEFIVVIEGDKAAKHYEECEKRMAALIDDYNRIEKPPVQLTIAYGMAEYSCGDGNLAEAEKLADDRMYEHKKKLKGLA